MQREKLSRSARIAGRPLPQTPPRKLTDNQVVDKHQVQAQLVLSARNKTKHSKLLNCKSLSHLVSKGLFFKRNSKSGSDDKSSQNDSNKLTATRSMSCAEPAYVNSLSDSTQLPSNLMVNGVKSASLIGLPRQSSCNYFTSSRTSNSTSLEEPSLSPIVAADREAPSFSFSDLTITTSSSATTTTAGHPSTSSSGDPRLQVEEKKEGESNAGKKKGSKYKPLKNTALVLRDVKNSIGLRMKARQTSQGFSKLSNELATPPTTKLYSPFNIYTPDGCSKKSDSKSRRKLNLNSNKNKPGGSDCSMMEVDDQDIYESLATPKGRIALQHRKHLLQANKFTFDSPTGKLRESVKDVEHFQQCIEDISKAIRSRESRRVGR